MKEVSTLVVGVAEVWKAIKVTAVAAVKTVTPM